MNNFQETHGIFITGTSTDVGKTLVTAALLRALKSDNIPVVAVKAVQTGIAPNSKYSADTKVYIDATPQNIKPYPVHTLYQFALAASPHLAAKHEGVRLTVHDLTQRICTLSKEHNHTPMLVEGAGGMLVPLNDHECIIDLAASLQMPLIIVVQNVLGALNHAQLSIDAAERRGLQICAVVMNNIIQHADNTELNLSKDNTDFLARRYPHIPFINLPFYKDINSQWHEAEQALMPLAKICKKTWDRCENVLQKQGYDSLLAWDKKHLWHPYTSATKPLPVYKVESAKGKHIILHGGQKLLDGMASWWCAIHGYSHPQLVDIAQKQAARLSHVMFGGLTHDAAIVAAQRLLQLMPMGKNPLSRVFWADSGSVAVEVALKMALQYQQGRGQTQRTRFLTPRGGYYGDTQGAMAVCDPINGMHSLFANNLPQHIFIEKPACAFHAACTKEHLAPLEEAFAKHGQNLAACIIEPIVQGAGGMNFYHPEYLRKMRELCTQYDVLLICDEIATGFGRTGKMFACEWANIEVDICCVGKALTGGFMNLAATICTEIVAKNVCANDAVFMHGPTFMANPLACAVAAEAMDILCASAWQDNVARIERALQYGLKPLAKHEDVEDVRVLGAIGVVEMKQNINVAQIQSFFVQCGVWIRPFGKLLYIMPPYIFSDEDINKLTSAISSAINSRKYLLN